MVLSVRVIDKARLRAGGRMMRRFDKLRSMRLKRRRRSGGYSPQGQGTAVDRRLLRVKPRRRRRRRVVIPRRVRRRRAVVIDEAVDVSVGDHSGVEMCAFGVLAFSFVGVLMAS